MLQFLIGSALSHLVNYFITMMMYLDPNLFTGGLIGPTKSISHLSNDFIITCGTIEISSLLEGFPTFW
jgi:hypothetical protein